MLRYGDGTPFPFAANVLAILEDAVVGCTAMFAAAADLDRQREAARASRRSVDEQLHKLLVLEQSVTIATKTARDAADGSVTHRAAQRALAVSQRVIADSRAELEQVAAVEAADPSWEPIAHRVYEASARFFEKQTLPNTRWTWHWDAKQSPARAEATGHVAPFTMTFDVEVTSIWRAPVRVGVLGTGITLQLPARRLFGTPTAVATKLDGLFLVEASIDADGRDLVLREKAAPSPGWRVNVPAQGAVRCHLIDRDGRVDGPEFELARDQHLTQLWTAIETEFATMHANRRVRSLSHGGTAIAAIADVTSTPRSILEILKPIVRAIRKHSRMPGELVLKRDVSTGVRTELYVSRQQIVAHYAELPAEYARIIDDAGFGSDLTETPAPATSHRFARASQTRMPSPVIVVEPDPAPTQEQTQPSLQLPPARSSHARASRFDSSSN